LNLPLSEFNDSWLKEAGDVQKKANKDSVYITALLGYDNICRNRCTYCGMRAGYPGLKRFRLSPDEINNVCDAAKSLGLKRIIFVSGEDPGFEFNNLTAMVDYASRQGLHVSLGAGEFEGSQYRELQSAGLSEYVLKFETSDRQLFSAIKPSTTYEKRMRSIEAVQECGLKLASGNIIGLPHQTLESLAEDILLMQKLKISWAPIIPYMPVPGTPLASEGGRGSLELLIKEIALLRILMPQVNNTAQQPGEDLRNGLSDFQGNLNALKAGANMLFVEMLPTELAAEFHVLEARRLETLDNVRKVIAAAGMQSDG
jgi:biotin synthase